MLEAALVVWRKPFAKEAGYRPGTYDVLDPDL